MRIVTLAVGAFAAACWLPAQADEARTPVGSPHPPELQKAMSRAQTHNTRVLVLLVDEGADLAKTWKQSRALSRTLLYEFEVVQFAGKVAHEHAVQWKFQDALTTKPAAVVFDAGGKELARLTSETLQDEAKLAATLQQHFAPPVDAEAKLAAALAVAKKTGRNVFIRFDAPW